LKPYEAVIIFNPNMTEDKIDVSISKFEKKLKESGGTDISTAKWGLKKLLSTIKKAKKVTEGYYVMISFNGESQTPNALSSTLRVSEEVIRYSVLCSQPAMREVIEEKNVEIEPSMIINPGEAI